MSINIVIDNKFVITRVEQLGQMQEKKVAKSGKNAGKEWLDTVGFYPSISKLVSGLRCLHLLKPQARGHRPRQTPYTCRIPSGARRFKPD
ncbi:hypothetical protein [Klebsiella quasipneumoniae]|uniref:hypothetical protein n=1 Tax=Klebsiella quasipneumoniae TaxID=1463165 RepID=UPI00220E8A73|nr:hypothetical protein [Klebsiella quasipneumoniae]BDO02016.1 hypothetical protein KAM622c_16030 [Klebsiella quasipneumoniae subsp. quasipneumoniae]